MAGALALTSNVLPVNFAPEMFTAWARPLGDDADWWGIPSKASCKSW